MDVRREHKETGDSQRPSLPRQERARTWAGHGSGASCDLCKHPIAAHEIEYEVELAEQVLCFHLTCHRNWLVEAKSW